MEKNISIFFSKLSPILEKENYLIELLTNNKTIIIQYPQNGPLIISLSSKSDRQIISIIVKSKQFSKKQRIIGHGDIILYKKFLTAKPIEKYILLFKENKENYIVKLNQNSIGKIYVQIKLDELHINKNKIIEKEINNNKKEIETNIKTEEIKENKNSKQNEFNIKTLYKNDDKLYNNIDKFLTNKKHFKMNEIIEKGENILPKDINSLKLFNNNLFNQYKILNEKYANILFSLSEYYHHLENKLENITNKNKEIKEEITKLEFQSNAKKEEIDKKFQEIKEKNDLFSKNLEVIKANENYLKEELINKKNKSNNKKISNINDIKDICNIIKKLDSLGYSIQEEDLTDSEKQNLYDLLNNFENEINNKNKDEDFSDENELNQMKDDIEFGEKIISLIERDVNDLFSRKLIELVNIDQIDSISYIFSGKVKKEEVSFKIEENNLICSTGENFTVWLIKNFSL